MHAAHFVSDLARMFAGSFVQRAGHGQLDEAQQADCSHGGVQYRGR